MRRSRPRAAATLGAILMAALVAVTPVAAQEALSMGQVQSPVLTIDVDRLLAETLFGQRLGTDLRARSEALAAENRRIEAELAAEELSLTERRPDLEPDAFRAEADAFDAKVQRIRAEQDAKERALQTAVDDGRAAFLTAATPVLGRLMAESGAAVILERRAVFLGANLIDVTDEAIAAIDHEIGEGAAEPATTPQGDDAPPPAAPDDGG